MCYVTSFEISPNRLVSGVLTCSFGRNLSELGGTVCKSNIELSSTSDNSLSKFRRVSILLDTYLFADEMFWAISAQ